MSNVNEAQQPPVAASPPIDLPFAALEWPLPRQLIDTENSYLTKTLKGNGADLIASAAGFEVYRSDLKLLAKKKKLNDNIMNFYLAMAVSRVRALGRSVQFIASQISMLFRDDGHSRTWYRDLDPFDYDWVVLPLHSTDHWAGVGIAVKDHVIAVADSIGIKYPVETKVLIDWLSEMYRRKYNREDTREWRIVYMKSPKQNNDLDCGMFALLFCICFLLGRKCNNLYSQSDIPSFRKLFALHIISSGRLDPKIKTRTYPPSDMFLTIQDMLKERGGRTLHEIYTELKEKQSKKKNKKKKKDAKTILHHTVWLTLNRKVKQGLFVSTGTQRNKRYYLNTYVAAITDTIESKKPIVARYSTPLGVGDSVDGVDKYTYRQKVFSVLHRYAKMTNIEIRKKLIDDGYVTEVPDRKFHNNQIRTILHSKVPLISRSHTGPTASYTYELLDGVLPPVDITQEQVDSGAILKEIDGRQYVFVPSDAQEAFLRIADSELSGQGCFLTQYVGAQTLFEVEFESITRSTNNPLPNGPFVFSVDRENRPPLFLSAMQEGSVTSRIAFANDAGPICSQLEPMLDTDEETTCLWWKTRTPVNAGTELFCAYNSGEAFTRSHWNFAYPPDWNKPDSVDPVTLPADMAFTENRMVKKRVKQPLPAKKKKKRKEARPSNDKPKRQKIVVELNPDPSPEPVLIVRRKQTFW